MLKLFVLTMFLILSQFSLAQGHAVHSNEIDLGEIRETLWNGSKKVVLNLDSQTPLKFKVKFKYLYKFVSEEINGAYVTPGGQLGLTTRSVSERFEGDETLAINLEDSTLPEGEDLKLEITISKPNKNTHGVKVEAIVLDNNFNEVRGHKKFLGLLGHSFNVSKVCPQ